MKNFIQQGENVTVTAAADVVSGQFLAVGALTGVAQGDAATGEEVVLVRRGVFALPKASAQAWTVGAKVYWDATNSVMTTTASGNTLVGVAFTVAANPSDLGDVLLDGAAR
ncbi:DUF2190 family protein [Loktanella sp. TSTF-M6]|uniref:DUF2190 family protein n=1 Tax=Loktanella gaetbuli TaxID=2881335 RepID=A0ABS8BTG3_9RHOB|nr:capsid cement protein [Loktanella gaetbuli]MCB5199025.1 DUF2190 family protein [Loktanella gaetbuli]